MVLLAHTYMSHRLVSLPDALLIHTSGFLSREVFEFFSKNPAIISGCYRYFPEIIYAASNHRAPECCFMLQDLIRIPSTHHVTKTLLATVVAFITETNDTESIVEKCVQSHRSFRDITLEKIHKTPHLMIDNPGFIKYACRVLTGAQYKLLPPYFTKYINLKIDYPYTADCKPYVDEVVDVFRFCDKFTEENMWTFFVILINICNNAHVIGKRSNTTVAILWFFEVLYPKKILPKNTLLYFIFRFGDNYTPYTPRFDSIHENKNRTIAKESKMFGDPLFYDVCGSYHKYNGYENEKTALTHSISDFLKDQLKKPRGHNRVSCSHIYLHYFRMFTGVRHSIFPIMTNAVLDCYKCLNMESPTIKTDSSLVGSMITLFNLSL